MHPGNFPPDNTAIVMADSGRTVTYGELDAAANRISHLLRDSGLQPGDHVALIAENDVAFLELLWGAHYAGLLYTAISTRLTAPEAAYIVEDCQAGVLVVSAAYAELGVPLAGLIPEGVKRFSIGGAIDGYDAIEPELEGRPDTPLEDRIGGRDMLYSSGTTGRPKGIKPKDVDVPIDEAAVIVTPILRDMLGVGTSSVYLTPAPMYHAAPLRFTMAVQQLGATVVLMEKFTPEGALEAIARHGVTHTQMVPTMFVRLLRLPQDVRDAADVSSLKVVLHAGAPCPVDVKQQIIDWWGPIVHEYYASTEGCGLTWTTSDQWLAHPGTVGKAVIGVAHVVGEDGEELPAGEAGRVFFSDGPKFEYHNDPAKTTEAHDARGWATCGDIGRMDDEGFLYLTDRASFMIISGGVNIYPQESEDVLISDPAVLDAAVFGVPNADFGEEVKAVVQLVDPSAASEEEGERLIELCRSRLSAIKCPRSVDFRAELPRHDTGKLYKRLLVDEYRAATPAPAAG
ncbi:acyl-CoA synthetase [Patulibacter sp.]|uniref:acyl-CoA synthetase n=1 Tax=Patulibacter sp. TaxID=1912859 RepID=UPI0027173742|nr:acyl-CoA synthetase [Patulibacter sp.]MDO9407424.1 acyl-CoA synthetase [Patulibacter sp.]